MTKEILQQALDALIESRDDVATCLADRQWLTGIALAQADAACGVSPGAMGCASNGETEDE